MKNFLDKIFLRSNNLDYISQNIKDLSKNTTAGKIFDAINNHSSESEVRYVGGCIRNIINKEKVDDIDLATNLKPKQVCDALKKILSKIFFIFGWPTRIRTSDLCTKNRCDTTSPWANIYFIYHKKKKLYSF